MWLCRALGLIIVAFRGAFQAGQKRVWVVVCVFNEQGERGGGGGGGGQGERSARSM